MSIRVTGEDIQRAIAELSLLEQVIRDLQSRVITLEASIADHERSLMFLDELSKSTEPMTVLMPTGAGGFVEATVSVRDRIRVGIGSGVYLDVPLERGRSIISRRKEILERSRNELVQSLQNYSQRADALRRFLERVEEAIQQQSVREARE